MKRNYFAAIALLWCGQVFAQANYTGVYGYSLKSEKNNGNNKEVAGPSGELILLQLDDAKYRFWLDVTIGSPSYNVGRTDGTITFVNDTASFDNTFADAESPCILKFRIAGDVITINRHSASFNCGFGNGVFADGAYTRFKTQPVFNNEWLKKQYHESARVIITAPQAEIFQDENGVRSFPKNRYVVNGDSLINIAETERTVYTEFFTPAGKFMVGWIRKTDLKMMNAN